MLKHIQNFLSNLELWFFKKRSLLGKKDSFSYERMIENRRLEISDFSDQELTKSILNYATWYFEYIGEHHPEVTAFKSAVDTSNIPMICKHWSHYAGHFVEYERDAGNKSRPYIMDCYFTYELYLEEYERRQNLVSPK